MVYVLGLVLWNKLLTLYHPFHWDATRESLFSRKSIFKKSGNSGGVQETLKHHLGNRTFRIGMRFENVNDIQSELSKHIQILLNGTIHNAAIIF